MFRRHIFLFLPVSCLFFTLFLNVSFVRAQEKPAYEMPSCPDCNVIVVSLDWILADHMSVYGYQRKTTPALERLAQKSIVFNHAVTSSLIKSAGSVSLLSGLYPTQHLVLDDNYALAKNISVLPDFLRRHGYRSLAVHQDLFSSGKQGLERFDRRYSGRNVAYPLLMKELENIEGKFFIYWANRNLDVPPNPKLEFDQFVDEDYSGALNLQVDEYEQICEQFLRSSQRRNCIEKREMYINSIGSKMGAEDWEYLYAKLDGMILQLDDEINSVLEKLKAKGLLEKTIIVITATRGAAYFPQKIGGRYYTKTVTFESAVRVPLMVYVPGLEKSIRIDTTVEVVDIVPTILDLVNIQVSDRFDGETLRKTVAAQRDKEFAYSENYNGVFSSFTIYFDKQKLTLSPFSGIYRLYDLKNDPQETNNIYSGETPLEGVLRDELNKRINTSYIEIKR